MKVLQIHEREASQIIVRHHYLHRRPSISFAYGLIDGAEIVGVITFGVPASRHIQMSACPVNPSAVIELNRLWVDDKMPRNTETWFLSRALGMLPMSIVVPYADTTQGHQGFVYRAANFFYAGWTDMDRKTPRLDYMPECALPDLLGHVAPRRHTREATRSGVSEKVRRKPKAKYWITTGNRRERKRLAEICAWPKLDWKTLPLPVDHG